MVWGNWNNGNHSGGNQGSWSKPKGSGKGYQGGSGSGVGAILAELHTERKQKEELLAEKNEQKLHSTITAKVSEAFQQIIPGKKSKKDEDEQKDKKTPAFALFRTFAKNLVKRDSDESLESDALKALKKKLDKKKKSMKDKKHKKEKKHAKSSRKKKLLRALAGDSDSSDTESSSSTSSSSDKRKSKKDKKKDKRAKQRRKDKRKALSDTTEDEGPAPSGKKPREIPKVEEEEDEDGGASIPLKVRNKLEKSLRMTLSSGAEDDAEWTQGVAKGTTTLKLNAALERCAKANPAEEKKLSKHASPSKPGKVKQLADFLAENPA